jgi:hypothetical protein
VAAQETKAATAAITAKVSVIHDADIALVVAVNNYYVASV